MAPAAAVGLLNHNGSARVRVKSRVTSCTKTMKLADISHCEMLPMKIWFYQKIEWEGGVPTGSAHHCLCFELVYIYINTSLIHQNLNYTIIEDKLNTNTISTLFD